MSAFWKTWIIFWCWIIIVFGAVLATAGLPALDGFARFAFSVIGGAAVEASYFETQDFRFAVALMGAVTLGWGLTILFLLPAIHAAGAPAWRGLMAAMLIWFVIDSAFSVSTGFALNALSNTLLLIGLLVPLLASGALKSRA